MKTRIAILISLVLVMAIVFSGRTIVQNSTATGVIHTHSVWSSDGDGLSVRDAETSCLYLHLEKFRMITSWSEEGPPLYPSIAHFRGLASASSELIFCPAHTYEFRLIDASVSTDKQTINGTWDVYRDGSVVCSACNGTAYDLNAGVGNQYSVDVDDPVYGTATWQYYGNVGSEFGF
jgi:hypothetical protein